MYVSTAPSGIPLGIHGPVYEKDPVAGITLQKTTVSDRHGLTPVLSMQSLVTGLGDPFASNESGEWISVSRGY